MSCYIEKDMVAFDANLRYLVYFCIIMYAVHKERQNQVRLFVDQSKAQ